MKTLQEIKDQVARKYGYTHWSSSILDVNPIQAEKYLNEVAKEYAKQAIEEQLKVAAKEATTMEASDYNSDGIGYEYWIADPKSILNCTRIELK